MERFALRGFLRKTIRCLGMLLILFALIAGLFLLGWALDGVNIHG